MKKKYGLFKVLIGLLLILIVLSYFLEGRDGSVSYIALGDVFINFIQSFYYFYETALFILVVGGFYGLLNRIPAYKKLIKMIVDKVSNKSNLFVIIVTIIFALLASLTGLNTILLLFIPFVVSIILLLGYDKLVALSATIGGCLVGFMGGIFVTFRDAASQYSIAYTTFDGLAGLDSNWSLVLPKILMLLVGGGLLVFYIISYMKKVENKEVNYELTSNDNLYVESRDRNGRRIKVVDTDAKVWPMVLCFAALLVILILGFLPWTDLFGIKVFTDFHSWLIAFTFRQGRFVILLLFVLLFIYLLVKMIKKLKADGFNLGICSRIIILVALLWIISIFGVYSLEIATKSVFGKWVFKLPLWTSSIYNTILSGNFVNFGNFANLGNFLVAIIIVILCSLVLKFIYKIDFEEAMDGFIYGIKKMIPAAIIAILACSIFVCSYYNGFFDGIITNASKSFGDNVVVHSLISLFGSVVNVDLYYTSAGIFSGIVNSLSSKANLKVYAMMFQSIYGLVQLVGPTSLMLIVGLSYLEVPYKTWVKYIWRLAVALFIVVFIILMIVSLL